MSLFTSCTERNHVTFYFNVECNSKRVKTKNEPESLAEDSFSLLLR